MRLLAAAFATLALAGCGSGANEHFTVESRLVGRSLEQAVYVPSGDTKGRPLLVLLHGRSSSPDSMAKKSITNAIGKLGEPCYVCGTPIARVDFEEHTIYYCPECQTGGRILKDRRLSRLLR